MITPAYARTMAVYNRWQNANLYGRADHLTDTAPDTRPDPSCVAISPCTDRTTHMACR